MLNGEGISVEVSKIDNELNNASPAEVEKKKKKKKVHFSDKNETIYYEKDETEHNGNFGIAFNNFNYFECFYNKLYNNYDFDEKYDVEFSPLNEDEGGDPTSYIEFHEGTFYGKQMELENNLEKEAELYAASGNKNTTEDLKEGMAVVKYATGGRRESGLVTGIEKVVGQKSTGNNTIIDRNERLKRSDFSHSFNEDSSFEVNNIKKAIFEAEEKTPTYNNKEYFGYEIDPFNMKNELKEGYIDKFGNYIYNEEYDNDEIEEAWLKSVDEKDPLTTFANERLKNKLHKEMYAKFNEENKNTEDFYQSVNIYDALFSLYALLIEKETPLKAMVRYKTDLQTCEKVLTDYRKQIEQFSATHALVLNGGSQIKEQNEKAKKNEGDEKLVEIETNRQNSKKQEEASKEKQNIIQINIKKKGDDEQRGQEENTSSAKEKIEIHRTEESESAEKNKKDAEQEDVNRDENNEPEEEKKRQMKKGENNQGEKDETTVSTSTASASTASTSTASTSTVSASTASASTVSASTASASTAVVFKKQYEQIVDETEKIQDKEEGKNNINEMEHKMMHEKIRTDEEKADGELSSEKIYLENSLNSSKVGEEIVCYTSNEIRDVEIWREYQQMLMVYQKLELDYKTIERRFNNLIDLTQKLTNEYKNVYFLTKAEFEKLYKRLEKYKENIEIKWQFKWSNDSEDNAYGPYSYTDIYQWISVGYVSAINPIHLRRINKENEVIENIWQVYDSINYLIFVSNENVKKKGKLEELNVNASDENSQNEIETKSTCENGNVTTSDDEDDESIEGAEFDISNRKRKKKKGLIQISKKKAKHSKKNVNGNEGNEEEEEEEDDDDDDGDDYDDYEF